MKSSSVTVGVFEAKTKLSSLIERVGQGASFVITKHEQPVAHLTGYQSDQTVKRAETTAAMRELRKRYRLNGLKARTLREEGRA